MTPLRSQKKKPKSALAEEETPRKKEENFREVREENSPPRKWNFKPPETPQFHSAADTPLADQTKSSQIKPNQAKSS
jgi:hypothetical protein